MSIATENPAALLTPAQFEDFYKFEFNGDSYTAADAGWESNGEKVFDIFKGDDEFVDSVMVGPLVFIEQVIAVWVEKEAAYLS